MNIFEILLFQTVYFSSNDKSIKAKSLNLNSTKSIPAYECLKFGEYTLTSK